MKKIKIKLNGESISLSPIDIHVVEFLTLSGFFNTIGNNEYFTTACNSLNPIYVSTTIPLSEPTVSQAIQLSSIDHIGYRSSIKTFLSTQLANSKNSTKLAIEILISFFQLYLKEDGSELIDKESEANDSIDSEGRRGPSSGGLGAGPQITDTATDIKLNEEFKLSEGSTFAEGIRNDSHLLNTSVKNKMKSSTITDEEFFIVDDELLKIAEDWLFWSKEKNPWLAKKLSKNKFYDDLQKVKRSTTMTNEQISTMLSWIKTNHFWKDHAISPSSLLTKSKNHLRKIDNILSQLKKEMLRNNPFLENVDWENPFE
jgi:hypothetical protein